MAYIVAEPCIGVKDTACVAVCPVECFYDAGEQLVIHPDECINCGACQPVCPPQAIFPLDELPEQHQKYIEINSKWCAEHQGQEPAKPKS